MSFTIIFDQVFFGDKKLKNRDNPQETPFS